MKLEIPIIVGFDDMESLLDDLKKLQTYKLFEDAEEVLVDIEDVAKVLMDHVKAKKSVTINDTAGKIKVTNCNDNISRQAICDALDKVFADRIKSAGFDSYETADRDTQLVCDGIMKAIDVVLDQPTVDHLADVSKRDLISRQDALSCFHDWIDQRGDVHTADEMPEYQRIEQLPSAEPKQRYTEEELSVFAHGISLSLLSKRSAQHWQYDEDTATEIKFLERLYEKVGADIRGEEV